MQRRAKRRHIAEFGVRQYRRERKPGRAELAHQPQGLAPLRFEADGGGNPRRRALLRGQPLFGQIQRGAEKPRAHTGPQRRRHGDLAIRNLAQRPTVLTRDADRMEALFRKARAVENQRALSLGHHRPQASPHAIGVPRRMGDEMLKRLIRHRLGHPSQHGLHRLSLAVAEHALHVGPQGQQLRAMTEAALELLQPAHQSLHARRRSGVDQCASRYRN
jgi:hypothetical protein